MIMRSCAPCLMGMRSRHSSYFSPPSCRTIAVTSSQRGLHDSAALRQRESWWGRVSRTVAAAVASASHTVHDASASSTAIITATAPVTTAAAATLARGQSATTTTVKARVKTRAARPSPRALSHVKQTPLFPGTFRHVSMFEGEHIYQYGMHTYTIFKESAPMAIIPAGCLLGYIVTHLAGAPLIPFAAQCVYLASLFGCSRVFSAGRRNHATKDLTGRHVIVTGGTSGIGKATAAQLAQMGANVTVLAKDSSHALTAIDYIRGFAKNAEEQEIRFQALDLEDFIAVREYCQRTRLHQVSIDILVNAAGRLQQHHVTTRFGDDVQLASNFLGPFLLTEGLLPLLEAAHGRIVYVACSAHVGVKGRSVSTYLSGRGVWAPRVAGKFDGLEQYGFTKLGNIFHAQELALRSYPDYVKDSMSSRLTKSKPFAPTGARRSGTTATSASSSSRRSGYAAAMGTANGKGGAEGNGAAAVEPHFTVCACSPGGVITNLYRDVPLAGTFRYLYYVYLLIMRSAWEGSQTVVNCCVRDDFKNGGYYMNTRYRPAGLSKAACSVPERDSVMAWTHNKMQAYL